MTPTIDVHYNPALTAQSGGWDTTEQQQQQQAEKRQHRVYICEAPDVTFVKWISSAEGTTTKFSIRTPSISVLVVLLYEKERQ